MGQAKRCRHSSRWVVANVGADSGCAWAQEIQNFKAFQKFNLPLEGRHLLVYGSNGSGKSSLYWALHCLLESARKPPGDVSKYFDPTHRERLLNIHADATQFPGEIAFTVRNDSKTDTTYRINLNDHGTHNVTPILNGNLASDFVTYRFFFGFSHFKNSDDFNLWPLFEQEILPFCRSTRGTLETPLDVWEQIKAESKNPNPNSIGGVAGRRLHDDLTAKTSAFSTELDGIIDAIATESQKFYDKYFSEGDTAKYEMVTKLMLLPEYQHGTGLVKPTLRFGIKVNGDDIPKPQSFLNEAKMTQFAIAMRFAASKVNLHVPDLKLLVLDDLLVSLDMSNRMKVVQLLLSAEFEDYQKIILTHDLGFFKEFHRLLGTRHSEWLTVSLKGMPTDDQIGTEVEKTNIEKAEEYLHGFRLDEAALALRKAVEETARRFNGRNDSVEPSKKFVMLSQELQAARNKLIGQLPVKLFERVVQKVPSDQLKHLVPDDTTDIDAMQGLDDEAKRLLKTKRRELKRLVSETAVTILKKIVLVDDILACRERVLNPAAHAGFYPRYFHEVQHALRLIKQLEESLE